MPLQLLSSPPGDPAVQLSSMPPATHDVAPLAAHAPRPHVVGAETNASSVLPSQSSSVPLQLASSPLPVPDMQLSTSAPSTHAVAPLAEHAPTPQVVGAGTKSSSVWPSQSSSTPSQLPSLPPELPPEPPAPAEPPSPLQLSMTAPFMHEVMPVPPHDPPPHCVTTGT
jgi:hypothetical protein